VDPDPGGRIKKHLIKMVFLKTVSGTEFDAPFTIFEEKYSFPGKDKDVQLLENSKLPKTAQYFEKTVPGFSVSFKILCHTSRL
jgi:hypothetical protein